MDSDALKPWIVWGEWDDIPDEGPYWLPEGFESEAMAVEYMKDNPDGAIRLVLTRRHELSGSSLSEPAQ